MTLNAQAKKYGRRRAASKQGGFTLLEALVTIGLTVMILSIYTAMLTSMYYISRIQFSIQATGFVQESLDILRAVDYDDLTNRTDGNLIGLAFTRGDWKITGGSDNKLELQTPTANWNDETGLAVLPGSYREDFAFTSDIRVQDSSPSGWGAGLALRYHDAENHYRFRFVAGGIAFDEVYRGTVNTLWSQSATYSTDTWYKLEVIASGDQFTLKRNEITLATVTDTRFTTGDLALITLDDASVIFDNVSVDGDDAGLWNFDSDTDGEYPEEWRRLSPYDLPDGAATLTLSDYLGRPEMKQATVTISWTEVGSSKNLSGSSIITR